MTSSVKVILVVDPAFGPQLESLPPEHAVWIVDTEQNTDVVLRQRQESENHSGITTFKADMGLPPEEQTAYILDAIELHHGASSSAVPFSILEVYGCRTSNAIREELKEIGFVITQITSYGFVAKRIRDSGGRV